MRSYFRLVFFVATVAAAMAITGEVIFPFIESHRIKIPTGDVMFIFISIIVYITGYLLYRQIRNGISSSSSSTERYDISKWTPTGFHIYEFINENSKDSLEVLQALVGREIRYQFKEDPFKAEVHMDLKALMGIAQSPIMEDKSNGMMFSLLRKVVSEGRTVLRPGGEKERFALDIYLKMIDDYYMHYGPESFQMAWFAMYSKPPIKEWELEGQPFWMIAAKIDHMIQQMPMK